VEEKEWKSKSGKESVRGGWNRQSGRHRVEEKVYKRKFGREEV
jgi:hypothetical protein